MRFFITQFERFRCGEPVRNVVDEQSGYSTSAAIVLTIPNISPVMARHSVYQKHVMRRIVLLNAFLRESERRRPGNLLKAPSLCCSLARGENNEMPSPISLLIFAASCFPTALSGNWAVRHPLPHSPYRTPHLNF